LPTVKGSGNEIRLRRLLLASQKIHIEPIPSYRIRLRLPTSLISILPPRKSSDESDSFSSRLPGFNFLCDFVVWPITRAFAADISVHILVESKANQRQGNSIDEPRGIAVHPTTGLIYVADAAGHRVHILTPSLDYVGRVGKPGTGSGEFTSPFGVAFSPDGPILAVTEHQNNRVQLFDAKDHVPIRTIGGGQSHLPGRFDRPTYIAFDQDENFYVADTNNERVQKFSKAGAFICVIGKDSLWPSVGKVVGLAVNDSNELLTIPKTGNCVRVYSTDGRFLNQIPVKETGLTNFLGRGPNGGFVLTSARHERMWTYGPSGRLLAETFFLDHLVQCLTETDDYSLRFLLLGGLLEPDPFFS
jgi:sugar lactone lactonase YvrE